MALHHLALGAVDVERLAAFYRAVFGLAELARHHHDDGALRSVWLDLDGPILMIERVEAPPAGDPRRGLFLLAFAVRPSERADLEARLEAAGCPIEARTRWSSYARDPEGNRVAVSHYPTEPP
jgi:catechol 2,3-dioxygenase-like lactoylglutathione lyase family enzyme